MKKFTEPLPRSLRSRGHQEVIFEVAEAKFWISSNFYRFSLENFRPFEFRGRLTSATLASSEGAQGTFSKITFSKSVRSNKKDEVCHSFLVEIFTKSLHRGGVPHQFNLSVFLRIYVYPKQKEIFKLANRMRSMLTNGASKNRDSCFFFILFVILPNFLSSSSFFPILSPSKLFIFSF